MKLNKIKFILIWFFFLINSNIAYNLEITILAQVNNKIITNQDLIREKKVLNYLFNNKISNNELDRIAIENLIELIIKKEEIEKNKMLISEIETKKYVKSILETNKKSLEDFRAKLNNKIYEDQLKKKIQIEISWNKLIFNKFSSLININMDEILSIIPQNDKHPEKIDMAITFEKKKKLKSFSDTYYNELKSRALIKY